MTAKRSHAAPRAGHPRLEPSSRRRYNDRSPAHLEQATLGESRARGPRYNRSRDRARGPCPAPHALQDVLRLPDRLRRRAEHADLPRVPGDARRAAGHQPAGGGVRHPHGAGVQLSDQHRLPVRAQALLLSGHAQELPDQPVRGAAGRGWLAGDRSARRHHAGASAFSACTWRKTSASSSTRALSRSPVEPGRLQPRRHAAHGDGLATRPPLPRGGGDHTSRRFGRCWSYLGVCDGNMEEGSLRCDANVSIRPRGATDAGDEGRDQEPELVPQRPARARVRGRAPGAGARGGGANRSGDAPVGS